MIHCHCLKCNFESNYQQNNEFELHNFFFIFAPFFSFLTTVRYLNPQPLKHELSPISSRPGLLPVLSRFFSQLKHHRIYFFFRIRTTIFSHPNQHVFRLICVDISAWKGNQPFEKQTLERFKKRKIFLVQRHVINRVCTM